MSSPCNVKISNTTNQSLTTDVTFHNHVKNNGASIDGKLIPNGKEETYNVIADTSHHGELTIDFKGGDTGSVLATLKIKSVKDPQKGEESLEVESKQKGIIISAMGYRESPDDKNMRRIDVVLTKI